MEPLWMLYVNDDDPTGEIRVVTRDRQSLFNLAWSLFRQPEWQFARLRPKADATAAKLG